MKLSEKTVAGLYAVVLIVATYIAYSSFDSSRYRVWGNTLKLRWTEIVSTLTENPTATYGSKPTPLPSPYVYHPPTSEQERYVLALGAILSSYNRESYDSLESDIPKEEIVQVMRDSWDITDRASALSSLDWLTRYGHRASYSGEYSVFVTNDISSCDELARKITSNALDTLPPCTDTDLAARRQLMLALHPHLGEKTLYAWDFGRLINVTRWSYSLGLISQEEAWTYIMPAAIQLQSYYSSWEEYGKHYALGRNYWLQDMNGSSAMVAIVDKLLVPGNKTPWTTIPWQTSLD